MPKGYKAANTNTTHGQTYEIVQLLRLNGSRIDRTGPQSFALRMGAVGNWNTRELSVADLKREFGHGTLAYMVLRQHPRASSIPVGQPSYERRRA